MDGKTPIRMCNMRPRLRNEMHGKAPPISIGSRGFLGFSANPASPSPRRACGGLATAYPYVFVRGPTSQFRRWPDDVSSSISLGTEKSESVGRSPRVDRVTSRFSWYGRGSSTLGLCAVPMHLQGTSDWVRGVCIALIALVFASPALAERGKLAERLTPEVMAVVYPRRRPARARRRASRPRSRSSRATRSSPMCFRPSISSRRPATRRRRSM